MPALAKTYAKLNRARTLIWYEYHDKTCHHCKCGFNEDDIKDFRITIDHRNGNRKDNSRRNRRPMHSTCHRSMTMSQRQEELHRCKKLVKLGLKKPGKTKYVARATKWGG